jgi:Mrp family chromosome partitioning ATPase
MIPLPIHNPELEDIYTRTFGDGLRSLAITSSRDCEGVSTIAYALARRGAADGRKTLLVDFNRRRPSVGPRLGLEAKPWLPGDDNTPAAVISLGQSGLYVLPAPQGETSELRSRDTQALRQCFEQWQQDFDCIVADTAPLTQRENAAFPSENVCAACDGALMVVLTGRTSEIKILEARDRLIKANANLIGGILNDCHAPELAAELIRETHRLDAPLPRLMTWLRARIENSTFLNQAV